MIRVKPGVQPPLVYLMAAVANVSERLGRTWTITSATDGKHSEWSGHYQLRALDARRDISDEALISIRYELKALMGVSLQRLYVKRHDIGTPNEHIHLQFK